jgi:2,5-dioxopentanoate dehydrogenase
MTQQQILIAGEWQYASANNYFNAINPSNGLALAEKFPISSWSDCEIALNAAARVAPILEKLTHSHTGREQLARFIDDYAASIEAHAYQIAEIAHVETGLAITPRLVDVEIPRTVNQLQQAAKAVRESSWREPVIDSELNIRSCLEPIGPVVVFGPNNFPCAFGSVSGGDFAAAIAAGNPVIAKAHPAHPATTQQFAKLAHQALNKNQLPLETVQLIYNMSEDDGLKLVADYRIGASAFTGSKKAGLALKQAADQVGKPIYLEMSSLNPVVLLEGALKEKSEAIATEFTNSCVMAAGQLCTKPGILIVPTGMVGDHFVSAVTEKFDQGPVGTLLTANGSKQIQQATQLLVQSGATLLTKGQNEDSQRFCSPNTLLSVDAIGFLDQPELFQQEIFGNASLVIRTSNIQQVSAIIHQLEGNLTGCIYSHSQGHDDTDYDLIEPILRQKVGRLLNDKMPTGVAISAAMNHGGPFPSSGNPSFSAVGLPGAVKRFGVLRCYDNVRANRLPEILQNKNLAKAWRCVDGHWTQSSL